MLAHATSLCVTAGWLLSAGPLTLSSDAVITSAMRTDQGTVVHEVTSPYQAGRTKIEILLPDAADRTTALRVLYVLPVEAGDGRHWGQALPEIRRHRLHVKHQLLCVYPTFSHLPWYADHPTDPQIRQESYLLDVVMPFVEREYREMLGPADEPTRWLLGFSKSGWGAFSLIFRHPARFQRAAAWDAPLMQARPDRFGMGPIFGTLENFRGYQISALLADPPAEFLHSPRLIHLGYDNFRGHHREFEQLLNDQQVQHTYQDGPQRRHHWNSGWLKTAIESLATTDAPAEH